MICAASAIVGGLAAVSADGGLRGDYLLEIDRT